jgi:hypothetical protein
MFHLIALALLVSLVGCSSIQSRPIPSAAAASGAGSGLVYYLPRRDAVVTIKVAESASAPSSVEIAPTTAYADLSQAYVLQYQRNLIGKNALDVGVTASGLLNSTVKTTTTGQLSQVFSSAADLRRRPSDSGSRDNCTMPGEHRFVIDLVKATETTPVGSDRAHAFKAPGKFCGGAVQIFVTKLWKDDAPGAHISAPACPTETCSGVYYRQNRPYLVVVEGDGISAAQLVESPSASPTRFLPMAQTLFANNDATFTFAEGVPTEYGQDTDGELVALLKFPATILKAYFGAVGGVLDAIKDNKEAEAGRLASTLKLELAKKQFDLCMAAVKAGKTGDELKATGCGGE